MASLFSTSHCVSLTLPLGALSFVYINSLYHVISRPLSILSRFEVPSGARSVTSFSANSVDETRPLSASNGLSRSLGGKSSENIASGDPSNGTNQEYPAYRNADSSRLLFGEEQDVGEAVFPSTPASLGGLHSRYTVRRDDVLGLAWTDTDILVRRGIHIAKFD